MVRNVERLPTLCWTGLQGGASQETQALTSLNLESALPLWPTPRSPSMLLQANKRWGCASACKWTCGVHLYSGGLPSRNCGAIWPRPPEPRERVWRQREESDLSLSLCHGYFLCKTLGFRLGAVWRVTWANLGLERGGSRCIHDNAEVASVGVSTRMYAVYALLCVG